MAALKDLHDAFDWLELHAPDAINPVLSPLDRRESRRWSVLRLARPWAVPVMTALLVTALTAGVVLAISSARRDSKSASQPSPTVTVAPVDQSPKAVTEREMNRLLALAPLLPGSRLVAPPTLVPADSDSPNRVFVHKFWVNVGTTLAAASYFASHAPAGLGPARSGGSIPPATTNEDVSFQESDTAAYTQATLSLSVTQEGSSIRIEASASAIWLPAKTAAEHLAPFTQSVAMTLNRFPAKAMHRTLGPAAAANLVQVLDGLPTMGPVTANCPADDGFTDVITLSGLHGTIVFTVAVSGCRNVSVTAGGVAQPTLGGGGAVNAAVLKALGLPPNYAG